MNEPVAGMALDCPVGSFGGSVNIRLFIILFYFNLKERILKLRISAIGSEERIAPTTRKAKAYFTKPRKLRQSKVVENLLLLNLFNYTTYRTYHHDYC